MAATAKWGRIQPTYLEHSYWNCCPINRCPPCKRHFGRLPRRIYKRPGAGTEPLPEVGKIGIVRVKKMMNTLSQPGVDVLESINPFGRRPGLKSRPIIDIST